jgi:hypothetical protein
MCLYAFKKPGVPNFSSKNPKTFLPGVPDLIRRPGVNADCVVPPGVSAIIPVLSSSLALRQNKLERSFLTSNFSLV